MGTIHRCDFYVLANMTLRTRYRAGIVACFFFRLVAVDAQFVHDLFRFQLSCLLEFGQRLGFLRKQGVTDIAVFKPILMAAVRKRHRTPGTSVNLYVFRPFIFYGQAYG